MILDKQLMFSDAQAVTVTANSTNVVDLTTARDIARGGRLRARVQVDTTFLAAGAGTLQAQYVESAAADLSSPTVLWDSTAVGKATLIAGYIVADILIPRTAKRYQGWIYTVATGPMTAGALSAFLLADTETPMADRPSNFNTGF